MINNISGLALAALLAGVAYSPLTVAQTGTGAAPTLAQVQQAYTQAHPLRRLDCDLETLFFSLEAPQNVVACRPDESTITLYYRGHATNIKQEQEYSRHSFYDFNLLQNGREVGTLVETCHTDGYPVVLSLVLQARLQATLGSLPEMSLWSVGDPQFTRIVQLTLTEGPLVPASTYFTAPVLNDKGYALQQLGCQAAALLFFNEVLRRYPTRAVAYLNRGDTRWALRQPAAAQADYRQYLALLRAQHKDTTRVPAYVRLALHLPQRR